MFKVMFTLDGRAHDTEFQARNGNHAAKLFARVFPNAGSILVVGPGTLETYLIRKGHVALVAES